MDREAWRTAVHEVTKESDTTERLNWTEVVDYTSTYTYFALAKVYLKNTHIALKVRHNLSTLQISLFLKNIYFYLFGCIES